MALKITIQPNEEPVSLAEAKLHLSITESDEDQYIDTLIMAARQKAENITGRALITQTWEMVLDSFPNIICVTKPPLQSITSIEYTDLLGNTQVLSNTKYNVDTHSIPARITPSYLLSWPDTRGVINAVKVTYIAGYGDSDAVPESIKQAMLLMIGHWYEHRESVSDFQVFSVPNSAEYLLSQYETFL